MLNFSDLDPRSDAYATQVVDRLLSAAIELGASDIHVERERQSIRFRWRVEGLLSDVGGCPDGINTQVIARIKALARLITYRYDIPQEGRLVLSASQLEARVGTLPTIHGERAVIRLAHHRARQWLPEMLGMPTEVVAQYQRALNASSGVVLITGTAGSGKTTTAYAGMRYLLQQTHRTRSLVSLEDPIESEIAGVAQSQINPTVGYSWTEGLRALLRQDPEVMMVGEIRDAETAGVVFQSAMTGQLVISTMHARSAGDAVRRLLDLQVPVHHLRCALDFLLCQRLVVVATSPDAGDDASAPVTRVPQTELLPSIEGPLAAAIQSDSSSSDIERAAKGMGMQTFGTTL